MLNLLVIGGTHATIALPGFYMDPWFLHGLFWLSHVSRTFPTLTGTTSPLLPFFSALLPGLG